MPLECGSALVNTSEDVSDGEGGDSARSLDAKQGSSKTLFCARPSDSEDEVDEVVVVAAV